MPDPDEKSEETSALVRLVTGQLDYEAMSDDDLVALFKATERVQWAAEREIAAELHRRHESWRAVGEMLAVNYTTARGWLTDPKPRPGKKRKRDA